MRTLLTCLLLCCAAAGALAETPPAAKILETHEKLGRQVSVSYANRPLQDVLADIASAADVTIHISPEALHAEGVTADTPISLKLSTKVSARTAFILVLENLRLTTQIASDGSVRVVAYCERIDRPVERIYDVSHLLRVDPSDHAEKHDRIGFPLDVRAELKNLQALIVSTIEPAYWQDRGVGRGQVSLVENRDALAITHTEAMHREIADLLDQLARLQSLQVMLDVQSLSLSPKSWDATIGQRDVACFALTDAEVDAIRAASGRSSPNKYLLMNGQSAQVPTYSRMGSRELNVQSVVTHDRRQVRLVIKPERTDDAQPRDAWEMTVDARATIALALPSEAGETDPRVLLITPRILTKEPTSSAFTDAVPDDGIRQQQVP